MLLLLLSPIHKRFQIFRGDINHRGMPHKHQSSQGGEDVERTRVEIDEVGHDQRRDLCGKDACMSVHR